MKKFLFFTLIILTLNSSTQTAQAYYHPDEGRWISRDPIKEQAGMAFQEFSSKYRDVAQSRATKIRGLISDGLTFTFPLTEEGLRKAGRLASVIQHCEVIVHYEVSVVDVENHSQLYNEYGFIGPNVLSEYDYLGLYPGEEMVDDILGDLENLVLNDHEMLAFITLGLSTVPECICIAQQLPVYLGSAGPVFGRGGAGLLNNNNYLRVGWGWKGTADCGKEVFRIAWGAVGSKWHGHFDFTW